MNLRRGQKPSAPIRRTTTSTHRRISAASGLRRQAPKSELNLEKDALAVEEPHREPANEHKRNRVRERGIGARRSIRGRKQPIVNNLLQRSVAIALEVYRP